LSIWSLLVAQAVVLVMVEAGALVDSELVLLLL